MAALAGLTLLIHAEQGLGDTLHMARYIPLIADRMKSERGARLIFDATRRWRVSSSLPGGADIIPAGQPLPAFDIHLPTLSIPLVFQTTLDSIPADIPYLSADPAASDLGRENFRPMTAARTWSGLGRTDPRTRTTATARSPSGNSLRCAGRGSSSACKRVQQLRRSKSRLLGMEIFDPTAELYDFADTAADIVANLDLVIAVDTAVAHLAGAMRKRAWVLIPFSPDWRWLMDRPTSPWYPTLRLFRQKKLREWPDVIEEVAAATSTEF